MKRPERDGRMNPYDLARRKSRWDAVHGPWSGGLRRICLPRMFPRAFAYPVHSALHAPQMRTIPAPVFRHLSLHGEKISSLCENAKKFVDKVLTSRRVRSIIGMWWVKPFPEPFPGRRNRCVQRCLRGAIAAPYRINHLWKEIYP